MTNGSHKEKKAEFYFCNYFLILPNQLQLKTIYFLKYSLLYLDFRHCSKLKKVHIDPKIIRHSSQTKVMQRN